MQQIRSALSSELETCRECIGSDFLAIARLDPRDNRVRWECASGNTNERFYQMSQRPGSGITGQVIRYGRPFILDSASPNLEQQRSEYPIMLVEQLASVFAIPLQKDRKIAAVLLSGHRTARQYKSDDADRLSEAGAHLAQLI